MNKLRYYVASSLENAEAVKALRGRIDAQHICTHDWTVHGSVQDQGPARIREVSEQEIEGVLSATYVIVLLPGGRGTHVELGAAIALSTVLTKVMAKPQKIIIVGKIELVDGRTCAFYHHPLVERVVDVDQLFEAYPELGA